MKVSVSLGALFASGDLSARIVALSPASQRLRRQKKRRKARDDTIDHTGASAHQITKTHHVAMSPSKPNADAGILSHEARPPARRLDEATCAEGFITCVDGMAGDQTCADACNGKCCVGEGACTGFSGKICRDGWSCYSSHSCFNARIDEVIMGCYGVQACRSAGAGGGHIGTIEYACHAVESCRSAAGGGGSIESISRSCFGSKSCAYAAYEGSIGAIDRSCHGKESCFDAADKGSVDEISYSCHGFDSCFYLGTVDGKVGTLSDSCVGEEACTHLAAYSGTLATMSSSCHGKSACAFAAKDGGSLQNVSDSCLGTTACSEVALSGGYVGEMVSSCDGDEACLRAGEDGGSIVGLEHACHSDGACSHMGRGENTTMSLEINHCCNTPGECSNITDAYRIFLMRAVPLNASTTVPEPANSTTAESVNMSTTPLVPDAVDSTTEVPPFSPSSSTEVPLFSFSPSPTEVPSFSPSSTTEAPSFSLSPSTTEVPSSLPSAGPTEAPFLPIAFGEKLYKTDFGIQLSVGLSARLIAKTGTPVKYRGGKQSTRLFHGSMDGAGIVPLEDGGYVYISNSEDDDGYGGVYGLYFDRLGRVVEYKALLTGTTWNCGGGLSPWNTFISCEEIRPWGQCWQIDPNPASEHHLRPKPTLLGGNGGAYESVAVDNRNPANPIFFVTEDHKEGPLRRFISDGYGWDSLHSGGTMTYLNFLDKNSFEWTTDEDAGSKSAELHYPNAEGISYHDGLLYFVSKINHELFILDLDNMTYAKEETGGPNLKGRGRFNAQPDQIAFGAKKRYLYFTEDCGSFPGSGPGVFARDGDGKYYTVFQSIPWRKKYNGDETVGIALTPDRKRLYAGIQEYGLLLEITRRDGTPFE